MKSAVRAMALFALTAVNVMQGVDVGVTMKIIVKNKISLYCTL